MKILSKLLSLFRKVKQPVVAPPYKNSYQAVIEILKDVKCKTLKNSDVSTGTYDLLKRADKYFNSSPANLLKRTRSQRRFNSLFQRVKNDCSINETFMNILSLVYTEEVKHQWTQKWIKEHKTCNWSSDKLKNLSKTIAITW